MTTARHFSGKSDMVTHLSDSALYELAAPSTPNEVRSVVVKGLKNGKSFHTDDIRDMVSRSKRQAHDAEQESAVLPEATEPTSSTDTAAGPGESVQPSEGQQEVSSARHQNTPSAAVYEPQETSEKTAYDPAQPAPADTTIADQIRQQRQGRIVTLIIEGLGEREPELLNMLSEGDWDQSTLFQYLMEKLVERQSHKRKPGT